MIERTVVIRNRLGLHARPAAEFVKTASRFTSDITLGKDGSWVNGKSIMGVMTLAAECGSEVTVRAHGSDAEQAVDDLVACLAKEYVER
jgi:phosphotransferase system HPr (HPr) family protein